MKLSKIFFGITFLLFSISAHSQIEKTIKEGDVALSKGYKNIALEIYLKGYKQAPENPEINLKVGKLYLEGIYRFRSLPYLEKAFNLNPHIDKEIHKYLALSYHYNHLFDKAIENYELCRKTLPKDDSFLKRLDREIYECQNGKEFLANPVNAKIENLGAEINTPFAEYGPAVSANESELIFTSRREGSKGGELDDDGEYFEDIYISRKEGEGWSKPVQISDKINTASHDASIGLSPDGNMLFIYKYEGNGDILYCQLKGDSGWSAPKLMGENISSEKYYENAAAISADGKVLFFSSTRPGGHGNLDIYMSELGPSGWGVPVNLGTNINTEFDEEGPILDLDGKTLYFSSMGHKGMGGFDIFRSVYDTSTKTWSEPQNLGYPINSADDDIYFALSGDGRHGYYASVKDGGYGDKDIYKITMPERKDYEDLLAKVKAIEKLSKLTPEGTNGLATSDPKLKSAYENIADDTEKNRFNKLASDSSKLEDEKDPKLFADQQKLRDEARARFEKLKLDNSLLGEDADPKLKAEKRALLDDARNKYEKLLADSVRLADEKDPKLKAERQRLLDEEKARFERLKSDSLKLAREGDEKLKLALRLAAEEDKIRLQKLKSDSLLLARENDARLKGTMKPSIEDGYRYKDLFIKNLHFDFDKATLRPESIIELEKIEKLLKENNSIKVKISAHTDNKGSVSYNSTLSKNRNKSVRAWLINHGIASDRIMSEEFGEEKPIASNDFEKGGRDLNRRVEFFIQE
jgi:outer membrane protein OmpA-like peptidoglycan-associated protein